MQATRYVAGVVAGSEQQQLGRVLPRKLPKHVRRRLDRMLSVDGGIVDVDGLRAVLAQGGDRVAGARPERHRGDVGVERPGYRQ